MVRGVLLIVRAGLVIAAVAAILTVVVESGPRPAEAERTAPRQNATPKKPKKPVAAPSKFVSIVAVGDVMMGTTGALPPGGARTFFRAVAPDLVGDVVLGNLEGTLSTGGASKCRKGSADCFSFQMPPVYAARLRAAGFTVLNLANNHAFDYGSRGLRQTTAALRARNLLFTGRPGQIALQTVDGVKVAVVGFSTYPWAASMNDTAGVKRLVRRAEALADVVIVTAHMGAEGLAHQHVPRRTEFFLGENRGHPIRFAHVAVDAGADLVVGHGPHVLRGMEWYRGRLIAYSLGNFAGYKAFALDGLLSTSAIVRVTLRDDGRFESGVLVPARLVEGGRPALDPSQEAHAVVRALSADDFGPRAVKVGQDGGLRR
jgi:poly-gamma-glutamate capsule biosynthesis protein CapA/YwtB (metallophosphatase superfamily)